MLSETNGMLTIRQSEKVYCSGEKRLAVASAKAEWRTYFLLIDYCDVLV